MKTFFGRRSIYFLLLAFTGSLAATASTTAVASTNSVPLSSDGSGCAWSEVASPNVGSPINTFYGVAAIASDDVWAVGVSDDLGPAPRQLIQRWDGSEWTQVATPLPDTKSELLAISAVDADDIWAVGGYDTGGQALIEHWNGSTWSAVPHPNPGAFNRFHGVAAISSQDVWAVGQQGNGGLSETLIEHWDGTSWTVVPSPNVPGEHNQLYAVTAVPGSNELWAVGRAAPSAPFFLHFDGTQWSLVSGPSAGSVPILTGVVALSPQDVWAVGWTSFGGGPATLTMHWNGSAWSVVQSPNPGSTYNYLWGVGATASNAVWAVGDYIGQGGQGRTLMLRWNGSSWAHVPGEDTGPIGLSFSVKAVSGISASDVWSVGSNSHSLAEHWDGTQWSLVPSPNAGIGSNVPRAVSGSSPADVWEVGYYAFGTEHRTLINHWNGESWRNRRAPVTNKRLNELNGVVAISPSDAWAVGAASSGSGPDQTTLIAHWDGNEWSIVPSPSPGTLGLNELHAVAATGANDVWAVGSSTDVGSYSTVLIEHWDGVSWSVIPGANYPGVNNGLFGVVALAPDDVWAVGYRGVSSFFTLVLHWDGSSWTIVPSADPLGSSSLLLAVSASGPNDVWAVGYSRNPLTFQTSPLIERWDGSQWSLFGAFANPNGPPSGELYGVAAVSPTDAWAVGNYGGAALIGRWNGGNWSTVQSPDIAARLFDVTAVTPANVFAVGQRHLSDGQLRSLNEHFVCDVELYCFCESGGHCSNPDGAAGCANSTGAGALLDQASGSTSVSADDLALDAVQVPPHKPGLFLMGGAPANVPLLDGKLCLAAGSSGVFRHPAQDSGASGVLTLGPGIVASSQSFGASGHIQPGSTWYFQAWYRDANGPCGAGANLSNGARVTFQP